MKSIILLATAAIAVPFIISSVASVKSAGTAVADRFLERSFLQTPTIPPDPKTEPPPATADNLHAWVTSPPALATLPGWMWLIFPLAYMLADLAEDCLIITLMTRPASISNFTVDLLGVLRNVKIGANALAITQIFGLGLAGCFWK